MHAYESISVMQTHIGGGGWGEHVQFEVLHASSRYERVYTNGVGNSFNSFLDPPMMCVVLSILGVSLFINNTSKHGFCPSKNVELKKIRKDIIHDKHDRPRCRTTLTVSINSIQCEKTVADLNFLCQLNENLSIYFQGDVNNHWINTLK